MEPAATPGRSRGASAAAVERIRAGIASDVAAIPTLAELASTARMSRYQLSRMFRKHVGTCLRDYVRDVRLERACALLATSRQSITTTAIECGFYDLSHFDRIFRRRFGMTPREFRARHAREAPGEAS
jgi:AraC family transcriptional regulator